MSHQTFNEHAVRVTRTIEFSMAHFYRQDVMSEAQNRAAFGACFTPYGHGHNYCLEISIEGVPDFATRLLVERSFLDHHLKKAVETLDHHHANFDVPEFQPRFDGRPTLIPTTENLCLYLVSRLKRQLLSYARFKLVGVKLFEMADLWVEWTEQDLGGSKFGTAALGPAFWMHEVSFRAVHRLAVAGFSEDENRALFDRCAGERGHHYRLQVTIGTGELFATGLKREAEDLKPQPLIQSLITQPEFEQILDSYVTKEYDGKNLNHVFPYTPQTTPEALLIRISENLRTALRAHPSVRLAKLTIFDGENGNSEIDF